VLLASDPPEGTIKIDGAQWRAIAAVGSGAAVEQVSERLDASDLATGRLLRSLVEAGLVVIGEAPAPEEADDGADDGADESGWEEPPVAAATEPVPEPDPAPTYEPYAADPAPWDAEPAVGANGNGHGSVDADVLFEGVHRPAPAPVALADHEPDWAAPAPMAQEPVAAPLDAAEFARRLAELPPRAAKAVAAAARATTIEERQAALAELDGTGEEIDHELLLQLLGPVDS